MCLMMRLPGVILLMACLARQIVGDSSLKTGVPGPEFEDNTSTSTSTSTTTNPPVVIQTTSASVEGQTEAIKDPGSEPEFQNPEPTTQTTPLTSDEKYAAMIEKKRSRELNKLKEELLLVYSIMFNKRPCNYTLYKQKMPQFWKAFRSGTVTKTEQREFAKQFWDISVDFKHNENEKIVVGNCEDKKDKHDGCLVTRHQQRMREMDLCFNGGLMECSEKTETCVCLNIPGIKTVRVDPDTGNEDENGKACFVEVGQQCMISHFGMRPIMLPCVNKYLCSTYSQDCVEPHGDWRTRKSHKHIITAGDENVHVEKDSGDDAD